MAGARAWDRGVWGVLRGGWVVVVVAKGWGESYGASHRPRPLPPGDHDLHHEHHNDLLFVVAVVVSRPIGTEPKNTIAYNFPGSPPTLFHPGKSDAVFLGGGMENTKKHKRIKNALKTQTH